MVDACVYVKSFTRVRKGGCMELHFRIAEAGDTEQAVPLIYNSGPEVFDYLFAYGNVRAVDFIRQEFLNGRGFLGHRNHIVALHKGAVIGIGACYSGADYHRLTAGTLRDVVAYYGLRGGISFLRKSLQVKSIMPPPNRSTLYIANLCVAANYRGQGVGTALLENQKVYAQNKKYKSYALDVLTNNPRAKQLYGRIGFSTRMVNRFRGFRARRELPDTVRMEAPL